MLMAPLPRSVVVARSGGLEFGFGFDPPILVEGNWEASNLQLI